MKLKVVRLRSRYARKEEVEAISRVNAVDVSKLVRLPRERSMRIAALVEQIAKNAD
jgi:hypothetical protein